MTVGDLRGLCIAGTDTDAGKTTVTAALLLAARQKGLRAMAIKPVQTGCRHDATGALCAPDVAVYHEACPEAEASALVMLEEACSPHLAAHNLGRKLEIGVLAEAVRKRMANSGEGVFALVESAGGVMTPLNESETMLDLFSNLTFPVLLVVANRLGAINQALLAAAALKARGVPMAGIVLTQPRPSEALSSTTQAILADNGAAISRMTGLPLLAELPYIPSLQAALPANRREGWEQAATALAPVLAAVPSSQDSQTQSRDGDALRFDREHIWHPYTSAVHPLTAREAVRTEGTRIHLADGRALVDGMSSWWCAVHGYNHPHLLRALHEQAERMPHVMFGGLTHEPAIRLARQLLDMAPAGLEHVFFADSGSVAVEVALKMAVQYQQACGKKDKSAMLTVRGGYHGDTLGAMSVCDPKTGMHTLFSGILPQQIFAPRPECRFDAPYDPASAEAFEQVLAAHAPRVAAVILEPIVQGAGGMWLYHPEYLRRVAALCQEHECLLILDEIATGFGRTGKLFACEWAGVSPDILCLGKALTGGVLTLSATLASGRVARGISQGGGVLMHGPTFMANPLACAVASASLDLLADGKALERVQALEHGIRQGLAPCWDMPGVADVRALGAIGVLEMERTVQVEKVQQYFIDAHSCWIRPFGRNMYIMPPFVASDEDIARLTAAMRGAVEEGVWE